MSTTLQDNVAAVVLAGGLARRMGRVDKASLLLAGEPLFTHVLRRIGPQVAAVVVNANGNPARFALSEVPVEADSIADYPGPLAGILAGLDWAAAHVSAAKWVVSVPVDTPFLPPDLVQRLLQKRTAEQAEIVIARSGGRNHPVVGLWPLGLRAALRQALVDKGERKVMAWATQYRLAYAEFPCEEAADPFFNINCPEDLVLAEKRMSASS